MTLYTILCPRAIKLYFLFAHAFLNGCHCCRYLKDGKCAECDGRVKNSGTTSATCVTCPAGKYGDGEGDSDCTDCAAGFYSAGKGSYTCTNCIPEDKKSSTKYTDKAGQAACEDCTSVDQLKQEKVSKSCSKTCPMKNVGCTNSATVSGGSRVSSTVGMAGGLLLSVVVLLNHVV
jgi:hypothetical protein